MQITPPIPHLLCPHCGWTGSPDELDHLAPWGNACPQCSKPVDAEGEARRAAADARIRELWETADAGAQEDDAWRGGKAPRTARPQWRRRATGEQP
jgi:hypothetical protein